MADTKFTPGRWIAAQKHSSKVGLPVVASPHGRSIASVTFFGLGENFKNHDDESYANAHLIAAAPELYEAANAALSRLELTGGKNGEFLGNHEKKIIEVLLTALAKARGEAV